ncbi:MAG TPA: GNAT family N-acetyltransferase [Nocardioides sp.]|uniref:GNAT family N-acetyltransferase n=1 Tax=Nocardioides sp. TaxID=35761 RepID=UPI002E379B35|nr:GNAT family N-acetyltransferase [Nocardioides sp.]HEX3931192.1 GNAT family N-acetyltransferase [Nocardioides sp.]
MSPISIRRLDHGEGADMDGFQEVYVAAELAEDPVAALYSREDGISILSGTDSGRSAAAYGAFAGDRMVGELMVSLPLLDNLDSARVWIWVDPAHQRRGIGTKLAAVGHAEVRDAGRHVCQATGRIGTDRDNGNVRFARSLGYDVANTEIERRLALPFDSDRLDRLEAEAAPRHHDYLLRTVVGPVPAELAASYVALKNQLIVEAPSGEMEVEAGQDTVAELAAQDRELVSAGRTRVAAYALDAAGTVVAYSVAATSNDSHAHVDQWGTLVDPAHRGHRLGTAVKCGVLRALSDGFPGKRYVETTNAETNRHMVAINEALGFEVSQVWGDFQRRLG